MIRERVPLNVTLSREAHAIAWAAAEVRGMSVSGLLEALLRDECTARRKLGGNAWDRVLDAARREKGAAVAPKRARGSR